MPSSNVSRHLKEAAQRTPHKPAVVLASGKSLSFVELDAQCDRFAQHFARRGVRPGMRVVVLVRPGLAFVPTLFGLFRLGAIPVCIDPGMKWKHLLECVKKTGPEGVVGISRAVALTHLFPGGFRTVDTRIAIPRIRPGHVPKVSFPLPSTDANDVAAILFTSGSTGVPKGVVYTHGAFDTQQRLLRETYGIAPDEVDLVVFPLFALFSAAWGITAVIPDINPARPAQASGRHLFELMERFGVTHTSGSPAIWRNWANYCLKTTRWPSRLRRLLMAGAQVPEKLVRACADLVPEVHTPYGATEALPLTTIGQKELFDAYPRTREGAGTCVGKALAGVDIAIIRFTDGPIPRWSDSLRLPSFVKGEVVVKAPWVTREYFANAEATARAKIPSSDGVWHRMGDVGYLDDKNRLWFCGRKDHRIFTPSEVLFPDPIEAVFDAHPDVPRSAVVGVGPVGKQRVVVVVQRRKGSRELRERLERYRQEVYATRSVEAIVFRKRFPLDVRHNIKIDRFTLARWVESEVLCDR